MKKFLLFALCTVFAVNTFAQDGEAVTPPAQKPSHKGFVTNKFWDNWEVSVGGGAALESIANRLNSTNHGSFWHRIGWEANVSASKWIHPVWGARLQLQGGQYYGYRSAFYSNLYPAADSESTPYIALHGDIMINLSNWIGGYREDRVYYAVPFAGFGFLAEDFTDSAHSHGFGTNFEYVFTAGLLNKFRVCPKLDVNLELKMGYYPERDHALAECYGGETICSYSATVGVTYRFGKRDWNREFVYTGPSAADYAALVEERDAAVAEASALRNRPAQVVERVVERTNNVYIGTKAVVFFQIDKYDISDLDKIRLDVKADQIKNGDPNKVYHIEGHADAETGNPRYNQQLSDKRAKAVHDYLVSKGVNPDQLTYKGEGDTRSPYSTRQSNRVAIID